MTDAAQALTANQEAGIRERLAQITPGEWEYDWVSEYVTANGKPVCNVGEDEMTDRDGHFIANAPRDVAALLGEIDRLRLREIDLCTALDVEGACPDDCTGKVRR